MPRGISATYRVDVTAVTLTGADGTAVQALPAKTRVDFAQYAQVTGLLAAATVPAGAYTAVTMTLDYSNADIRVEDARGNTVQVTTIQDDSGAPLTTLQVPVLMTGGALTVTAKVTRHMTLDFDLQASNAVNAGPPVTMTVAPVLLADVDPSSPKPRELRGGLAGVDLQAGSFRLGLRPFLAPLTGGAPPYGTLTVAVDSQTVYDIEGVSARGGAGLSRLASLSGASAFVPVVVRGRLDTGSGRLIAAEVQAGSSVPGYRQDTVRGTVSKRAGDVLTVRDATLMKTDGSVAFRDGITVQLADTTPVVRRLSTAAAGAGDISVGQRITAFGTLSGASSASPGMDAGRGRIRMGLSTLRGTVASASPGFALALQSIDRVAPAGLDFAGTGVDSGHDADPADYLIDTGGPAAAGLARDVPVEVRGFVTPFGQAGGATPDDFSAETVVDLSSAPALMVVNWRPARAAAFENPDTTALTLNLGGVGRFHSVDQGGVVTDLSPAPPARPLIPVIQPPRSDLGAYSIRNGDGTVQGYGDFAGLVTALTAKLAGGAKVVRVVARGVFDRTVSTLTAGFIRITLG